LGTVVAGIPAYNEEKTIGSLVIEARRHADIVAVVDDGSTDKTAWIAEQAGATVIRHGANRGYGAALGTCFEFARANGTSALVIMDGDGQHRPEAIPRLLEPILNGSADITVGSRFLDRQALAKIPRYRRFGIGVLTKITNVMTDKDRRVTDAQCGFRAYSRRAVDTIVPKEKGMGASAEILWEADKSHLRVVEVPVEVDYDLDGSTEGPIRHAWGVLSSMVRYVETEHSLAAFGIPGAILIALGILLGIDVINRYYASPPPRELAVGLGLVTLLLMILGMLMAFTGLILHAVINANRRAS
jgi:glycosyltransferase involved in cell wall biosynthesis